MVVRPEKNRRKVVFRAAQNLSEIKIPVYGLVANCIEAENSKGYTFGQGEGYGYGYGYGEDDNSNLNEANIASPDFEDSYADINFQIKPAEKNTKNSDEISSTFRKTA